VDLRDYYQTGAAFKKHTPTRDVKAKAKRDQAPQTKDVRSYVFARERNVCRCCRCRPAESMHELRPRSLRGTVSRKNSIAVCGSGTTGCHGYLQQHKIAVGYDAVTGAEGTLIFTPETEQSAEHLKIALGAQIVSRVFVEIEAEE
jgi:hypothetical protein